MVGFYICVSPITFSIHYWNLITLTAFRTALIFYFNGVLTIAACQRWTHYIIASHRIWFHTAAALTVCHLPSLIHLKRKKVSKCCKNTKKVTNKIYMQNYDWLYSDNTISYIICDFLATKFHHKNLRNMFWKISIQISYNILYTYIIPYMVQTNKKSAHLITVKYSQ